MSKLLLVLAAILTASVAGNGAEKIVPGPKGGKLLENTPPRAEFFVDQNRKVVISFYDEKLSPVPAAGQAVSAVAQTKRGKETLEFEKKGDVLVSNKPLPEGDGYTVVVQLRSHPGAKPRNFRIKYESHICGECKRVEYACICGH